MNICIFEDLFISQLAPLNLLRHTSKLICGADTLLEKITRFFPSKTKLTLHTRKYLQQYLKEKFPKALINELAEGDYIFFNSRVVFKQDELKGICKLFKKEKNTAILQGKIIIAFHLTEDKAEMYKQVINNTDDNLVSMGDIEWLGLNKIERNSYRLINTPADLILFHEDQLNYDLSLEMKPKKKLHLGKKCRIAKNTVFDTSNGRIFINDGVTIEPFTYIKGPVYIGENSTIKAGTQIYGPVRIGGKCKVSGEISHSIMHWYVNKQHYGFLGHSYLCEWVNLGAGTTTSNLKNNFSNIVININGEKIDTHSIFLGSIIGDHTKTGIETMLNTGTIAGISCNLYGSGYHSKKIKSFSWKDAAKNEAMIYQADKAVSTAKISMKRREIEMSEAYEAMLIYVYEEIESTEI